MKFTMNASVQAMTRLRRASAAAKVILCGEHAVVYGRPAIAVPVSDLRAEAILHLEPESTLRVHLPDVNESWAWPPGPPRHPLALVIRLTLEAVGAAGAAGELTVRSHIPVAGGLGSSAAVATAVARVLAAALEYPLPSDQVSRIVYQAETIWHGTPSGIDNTVVAYEQPVWFVRGQPPEPFLPAHPFRLVIADSGIGVPTREVVGQVRRAWERDPARHEALFDAIAAVVHRVRAALEAGDVETVGALLDENQRLLAELGVSSPWLDRLVTAAREAGALGAKLAGAGRGGNVIALVTERDAARVAGALRAAGAQRTFTTRVQGSQMGTPGLLRK